MSYTCHGTRTGLPDPHQHELAEDAKYCYGILTTSLPVPAAAPAYGGRLATERQLKYIEDLGGDPVHAAKLTVHEASEYIDRLKREKRMEPTPAVPAERPKSAYEKKLEMIAGLLEFVPDGYFAVQEYDGGHITFLRISSPDRGKYKDSRKFQLATGSGLGVRLDNAAVWWPSKRWSVYKGEIVEAIMLLCADYQSAALRYSEKMGKCCRCNAPLTDGRSRWYGIGPECEEHWPWIIDWVTDARGPFRGER